jgi:hypothetical protein
LNKEYKDIIHGIDRDGDMSDKDDILRNKMVEFVLPAHRKIIEEIEVTHRAVPVDTRVFLFKYAKSLIGKPHLSFAYADEREIEQYFNDAITNSKDALNKFIEQL